MKVFVTGGSGFLGRHLLRTLVARGDAVVALTRSSEAAGVVTRLGAKAFSGDVSDVYALAQGMAGCDVVFHAAASLAEWEPWVDTFRITVQGTQNVLDAAVKAGVRRLVHVSTEAVLTGGAPIVNADETRPANESAPVGYPRAKALAERRVREANGNRLETVIVRPRLIWGPDDTSLLEKIAQAARSGRFMWLSGGHYLTSTCHVDNVCEGMLLAATRGRPGETYFLTDGAPVEFREFISALLRTQGLHPTTRSVPYWLAASLASVIEPLWRALRLKGPPPVTTTAVQVLGREVTVLDAKARRELGYEGRMSVANGLEQLAPSKPFG